MCLQAHLCSAWHVNGPLSLFPQCWLALFLYPQASHRGTGGARTGQGVACRGQSCLCIKRAIQIKDFNLSCYLKKLHNVLKQKRKKWLGSLAENDHWLMIGSCEGSEKEDFLWLLSVISGYILQHFVCAKCEKPFLGHRHYEKKGLAYCETHYHQVRVSCCRHGNRNDAHDV